MRTFTAPDSICQNSSFQLFNSSRPATGKLLWNFGNGGSSAAANPVIAYQNDGIYNISLVADFGSCKDSVSKPIKILPRAIAKFTADKTASCSAPLTIQFTSQGVGATSYKWLFGDSSISTLQNPSHTYLKNGNYTVTLIVTNNNGCTDTLKQVDYINAIPAAVQIESLPSTGCVPLLFSPVYSEKSVLPIISREWDFGDGSTSTAANPSHLYNKAGSYTVTLTYTTSDGCTGTINYPGAVKVGQQPVASFGTMPTSTCASTPIVFTDNSTGSVTSWLWNFGDGITDTSRNPVHLYNDTGYFSIQLIAGNNGCMDTVKPKNVYIKPPVSKFATDVQCSDPFHFAFTNYSVGAGSWAWDFGDGTSSASKNPAARLYQ